MLVSNSHLFIEATNTSRNNIYCIIYIVYNLNILIIHNNDKADKFSDDKGYIVLGNNYSIMYIMFANIVTNNALTLYQKWYETRDMSKFIILLYNESGLTPLGTRPLQVTNNDFTVEVEGENDMAETTFNFSSNWFVIRFM